ncbi:DHS-like NAD/FAD-binding domain-containing protein [Ascobolus immersus RN42]|uniref:DHS-like NAD/FAD-binding domain-containing protein n=1 Tax=Ascobolus immersus RN42 TaxID=1160509 RepID=A0A3N4HU41_ASCIM|nr:DHS-like NAD/FAD-binding domain-containing protein [Ascobolus immersus RN42]
MLICASRHGLKRRDETKNATRERREGREDTMATLSPPLTLETTSPAPSSPAPDSQNTITTEASSQTSTPKPRKPPTRPPPQLIDLTTPLTSRPSIKARSTAITKLLKTLQTKKKIVVIAGAGISVSAGIPDFRSSTGLFTTLKSTGVSSGKALFDANVYKENGSTHSFHAMIRSMHALTSTAESTSFHHLLASLAKEGRLLRLYTQNVDGLETRLEPLATTVPLPSKGPWPRTVQLHGALGVMVCSRCKWLAPFQSELFEGADAPNCPECEELDAVREVAGKRTVGVGKLRPRMVLYNEENPDADAIGAVTSGDLKSRPDCVVVVGTSLRIPGVRRIVREMCGTARSVRGGVTVWVNRDDPPTGKEFEGIFDLVVRGECEQVAEMVNMPRWDGVEVEGGLEGVLERLDSRVDSVVKVGTEVLATPETTPPPVTAKTKTTGKRKAPRGGPIGCPRISEKPTKRKAVEEGEGKVVKKARTSSTVTSKASRASPKKTTKRKAVEMEEQEQVLKKWRKGTTSCKTIPPISPRPEAPGVKTETEAPAEFAPSVVAAVKASPTKIPPKAKTTATKSTSASKSPTKPQAPAKPKAPAKTKPKAPPKKTTRKPAPASQSVDKLFRSAKVARAAPKLVAGGECRGAVSEVASEALVQEHQRQGTTTTSKSVGGE